MFRVVQQETGRVFGKQTLVQDDKTRNFFLVTSLNDKITRKTFILQCDFNGQVFVWDEVYVEMPGNHEKVISRLVSGELTTEDFNYVSLQK